MLKTSTKELATMTSHPSFFSKSRIADLESVNIADREPDGSPKNGRKAPKYFPKGYFPDGLCQKCGIDPVCDMSYGFNGFCRVCRYDLGYGF